MTETEIDLACPSANNEIWGPKLNTNHLKMNTAQWTTKFVEYSRFKSTYEQEGEMKWPRDTWWPGFIKSPCVLQIHGDCRRKDTHYQKAVEKKMIMQATGPTKNEWANKDTSNGPSTHNSSHSCKNLGGITATQIWVKKITEYHPRHNRNSGEKTQWNDSFTGHLFLPL